MLSRYAHIPARFALFPDLICSILTVTAVRFPPPVSRFPVRSGWCDPPYLPVAIVTILLIPLRFSLRLSRKTAWQVKYVRGSRPDPAKTAIFSTCNYSLNYCFTKSFVPPENGHARLYMFFAPLRRSADPLRQIPFRSGCTRS